MSAMHSLITFFAVFLTIFAPFSQIGVIAELDHVAQRPSQHFVHQFFSGLRTVWFKCIFACSVEEAFAVSQGLETKQRHQQLSRVRVQGSYHCRKKKHYECPKAVENACHWNKSQVGDSEQSRRNFFQSDKVYYIVLAANNSLASVHSRSYEIIQTRDQGTLICHI